MWKLGLKIKTSSSNSWEKLGMVSLYLWIEFIHRAPSKSPISKLRIPKVRIWLQSHGFFSKSFLMIEAFSFMDILIILYGFYVEFTKNPWVPYFCPNCEDESPIILMVPSYILGIVACWSRWVDNSCLWLIMM